MTSIIFTRSSSVLSKVIRWLSNEPVSHLAILFDNRIVFHSNLYGTHPEWLCTFLKDNEIVYKLDFSFSLEEEENIYLKIPMYDKKPYAFLALIKLLIIALLYKIGLNPPIPKENILDSENKFLCTELAVLVDPSLKNLNLTSPYRIYLKLKKDI